MGLFEITGLCQQAHNHPCIKGGDSTLHQRNSATFMQNGHGKFRQTSAYVHAKPWRPFARCVIPQITLSYVLYDSIKK